MLYSRTPTTDCRLPIALLPYPHNRQPITLHPYPYMRLPIAFLPYPRKPNRARTVVHGTGVPHLAVADSLCAVVHGTVVPHLAVADSLCGVVQVCNCTKAINYPMADNMSHLAISSGIAFSLVVSVTAPLLDPRWTPRGPGIVFCKIDSRP